MENKIYSFLGLAAKARGLASGDDTCEKTIKAGKAHLVIVSEDASDNTKKKFTDMCKYKNVEIRIFGEKEAIGRYIGKGIRSIVAITNKDFAKGLMGLLGSRDFKDGGEFIGKS